MNYPILYNPDQIRFGELLYKREDKAEILHLFKVIFNRDFKEDILDWYEDCPTGQNRWYTAFCKGKSIALYGLLPIKIKIVDKISDGALCNNVGVIPEYQGTGLFQALGEFALKDINVPIVVGVPNAQAVKGHKRIGWQNYGVLDLLSGKTEDRILPYHRYFPDKYEQVLAHPYFSVVKDFDFLRWRYSRPGTNYHQLYLSDGGYIIWKDYEGKKQVLETNCFSAIKDLGGTVDVWQFRYSVKWDCLKRNGFTTIASNEFLLYTQLKLEQDKGWSGYYKFELGDNDVF